MDMRGAVRDFEGRENPVFPEALGGNGRRTVTLAPVHIGDENAGRSSKPKTRFLGTLSDSEKGTSACLQCDR